MNVLVLGGDKRYLQIINNFIEKGYHVDLVGYKTKIDKTNILDINNVNVSKYNVILFPVNGVKENYIISGEINFKINPTFLENANKNTLIFSGIKTPSLDELLKKSNCGAIILMNEKDIIRQNVIPTVEGIIADIITNTDITLKGSNVLVIGYGNVGKYLTDVLTKLGSNTIVSIKEKEDKTILDNKKIFNVFSDDRDTMNNILTSSDIIINTVPTLVLDEKYINSIKKETYVLDISSYPHGINQKLLKEKGINYKIYLGIPSKVAPKTSGLILTKKINTLIGG